MKRRKAKSRCRRKAVRGRCPECVNGLCDWCRGKLVVAAGVAARDAAREIRDALNKEKP